MYKKKQRRSYKKKNKYINHLIIKTIIIIIILILGTFRARVVCPGRGVCLWELGELVKTFTAWQLLASWQVLGAVLGVMFC